MMNSTELLSEHLRPQTLDDLIVPNRVERLLKKFVNDGQIMNVIFYGTGDKVQLSDTFRYILTSPNEMFFLGKHKNENVNNYFF